jgi:hypothetical protein
MVLVLIVGSLLGYFSGYFLIPPTTQTVTVTQPTTLSIERMLTTTVEKTLVTTEVRTSTLTSVVAGTVEMTVTREVVREMTVTITPTRNMTEVHMVVRVGETASLESYEFSATSVENPEYIKLGESYYMPHEGNKILVVRLRVLNVGEEAIRCPVGGLVLTTDKGSTYEEVLPWYLEPIPHENVGSDVVEHAMEYEVFPYLRLLRPNDYCEGDILFEYPVDEVPASIMFQPDPYTTIEVLLS